MRKIIVLSFITLDGVMQAPGGPEEDTSGVFKYGGWCAPYFAEADEAAGEFIQKHMKSADLLLGRKTFEFFASYWPEHGDYWPGVNDVTHYAVSKTMKKSDWKNSVILESVADIKKLKDSEGADIQVHGSGNLIQTLLKHDLVDELWLKTFPVVLGTGKRLFADGAVPAGWRLLKSQVSPSGVVVASYARAGEVKFGSFAPSDTTA